MYIGSTWKDISYTDMGGHVKTHGVRIVFEITERTTDKDGQVLLFPDIELNTWWDNTGCPDKDVIELYHQHATMEQYHSELKTDMGMERLPSGKFATLHHPQAMRLRIHLLKSQSQAAYQVLLHTA